MFLGRAIIARDVPLVGLSGLASTKHCFPPSIIGVITPITLNRELEMQQRVFMGCVISLEW